MIVVRPKLDDGRTTYVVHIFCVSFWPKYVTCRHMIFVHFAFMFSTTTPLPFIQRLCTTLQYIVEEHWVVGSGQISPYPWRPLGTAVLALGATKGRGDTFRMQLSKRTFIDQQKSCLVISTNAALCLSFCIYPVVQFFLLIT